MKLHENTVLFRQAIQFTSDQMKIIPVFIEKDYWVTFALKTIFSDKIGDETIFKGGTSLSKCFKLIDRFSEDIDLVVIRREEESDNKLKTKIKTISRVINAVMPEVDVEGLTVKKGKNRKTAHKYLKLFEGNFGQISELLVIESTWLGYYEPYTTKTINSLVGEMMLNNRQEKIAQDNGLLPFDVRVLDPKRTFCEKIMSLVRFSYAANPSSELKKKIRHTYDLHKMLQKKEFSDFLNSMAFDEMLQNVANDDVTSFKDNGWLAYHPNEALMFKKLDEIWNELKYVYNGDFRNLVYGVLPNDSDVLATMKKISERMSDISWNIKI